jgi:glycosyltransferase involved in cell wall biosynthesis
MKVLHVIPTLAARTGGPPASVVAACRALASRGVDTTVVATDMAEAASAKRHARVALAGLPSGAADLDVRLFPAQAPRRLAFSPALFAAVNDLAPQYDVVHVHSLFLFPQFAAWRAANGRRIPYIVSPRGALDPHLRGRGRAVKAIADALWQSRFLGGAAAIHVTSDDEARLIAGVAPSVPRVVVPNGIDCDAFASLPSGDAFTQHWFAARRDEIALVLFLGRLSHKKGIDVLIDAFASIARERPQARLAIAGPDDEGLTPALQHQARAAGIADRVAFTGMLDRGHMLKALAAARAWALPSLTENFGNAVVEAMAAGIPTVFSPHVNIAPEIAAADAGIVAERHAAAFARAIAPLLDDPARAAALGDRARTFARRYDWRAVAPRLEAMYQSVLRSN